MTMEKLKKRFNTSPMIKKKGVHLNGFSTATAVRGDGSSGVGHLKTFGASLEELALRERSDVPLIVRKICEYVMERGLTLEGLFRINGNVRLIQNLMAIYDAEGDIDLTDCNDVHSVAGLLKRFVRDLSDGLIPERLTADFIKVVEENCESDEQCVTEIQKLLNTLSHESYATLRYLCFFLWEVCQRENENKMSAGSLGIVFGPNVFRCGDNCMALGLSLSYTHCNRAMSVMISNCHAIFDKLEPGCVLPKKPHSKSTPPPRPPPPTLSSSKESPRLFVQANWGRTQSEEPTITPRPNSPFMQDNSEECSISRDINHGPPTASVSNVIHYVINDSIFGDDSYSPSPKPRKQRCRSQSSPAQGPVIAKVEYLSGSNRKISPVEETPVVAPRRRRGKSSRGEMNSSLPDLQLTSENSEGEHSVEVTARIAGESDEDRSVGTGQDLRRQIQGLKRQIRRYEDEYQLENGHKPSMSEKNADTRIRACLTELAACRRRLHFQDASDDSEPVPKLSAHSRSVDNIFTNGSHDSGLPQPKSRSGKPLAPAPIINYKRGKLEIALEELEHELQVKRELSGRPDNILSMTLDQVKEEKATLQRALLNHESRYGRPQTLEEKEVMRPIYDRYRIVKRHLSETRAGEAPDSLMVQSAIAGSSQSPDEGASGCGDLFAVTQDFQSRMKREGLMSSSLIQSPSTGVQRRYPPRRGDHRTKRLSQPIMPSNNVIVGELTIEHLREEEERLTNEKKILQRQLKQYERQFEAETGRKLEKEDRKPMHQEYIRYKNIKTRLKDLQLQLL